MTSPLETTRPLPAVVQPTPSPSVICLHIPPPPAPPAPSRPIKRRRMIRVAAKDSIDATTGPRDWGNDASFENSSSLSLLIDWLGSGKNFEAFKFGVKGKRQAHYHYSHPQHPIQASSHRSMGYRSHRVLYRRTRLNESLRPSPSLSETR